MQELISFFGFCRDICTRNIMILFVALYVAVIVIIGIYLKTTIYNLAAPKSDKPDVEAAEIARLIAIVFVIGTILMGALLVFDYYGHSMAAAHAPGAKDTNTSDFATEMGGFLGTFGDFFGGFVNPVLTFGTLIALAVTILLQRVQLRDARSEASQNRQHANIQAFETTFFHLLNLHAENVKNLSFDPAVVRANPNLVRSRVLAGLAPPSSPPVVFGRQVFAEVLKATAAGASSSMTQLDLYRLLQKEHNHILGHYFRHLYQVLNLVDKLSIEGDEATRYKMRKGYTSFLRAQLSSHELAVLFLNCTFNTVDDGKFRNLLIWYKLLEHLPVSMNVVGELSAPGIVSYDQWIFFEYFDAKSADPLVWLPGAFGKNPVVKKFLDGQGNNWAGPVPWRPKSTENK